MRTTLIRSVLASLVFLATLSLASLQSVRHGKLLRRQYSVAEQKKIAHLAKHEPADAAAAVLQMPRLNTKSAKSFASSKSGLSVSSKNEEMQLPWFEDGKFPYDKWPEVPANDEGGWKAVPAGFNGFQLKDDLVLSSSESNVEAVQPYYITSDYTANNVKRAIIVLPGVPRDSWKYATEMKNVMDWVTHNRFYGVEKGNVIIIAPLILTQDDQKAGGVVQNNWAVYRNSNWEFGGETQSPNLRHNVSFYTVMDNLIEKLLDHKQFPSMKNVVVAGHSMGGKATMRYALLRHKQKHEDKLKFWIANPGSWTWLSPQRPVGYKNCKSTFNDWPYGLNGSKLPKYARNTDTSEHVDVNNIIQDFRSRDVHYALGLLDNDEGDTHCQSHAQGHNHLERGSYFVQMLSKSSQGFPESHSLSYISGVAHQDYPMFGASASIDYLFGKDF